MDPRDQELAELKAALAARDAQLAAKDARIAELERQVAELTQVVMALKEQLGRNSGNSSRPPSSDSPSQRAERRGKTKSERKRGGQPGHSGSTRALLPPEEVDKFVHLFPPRCESCWEALPRTPDPSAQRFQTTELPPVKPYTTEYLRHAVVCPGCHYKTWVPVDQIPASPFGPRLSSTVALVTGVYHLGRRVAVSLLADFFRVKVSLGTVSAMEGRVSEAVEAPVDEAWKKVGPPGVYVGRIC